MPDRKKKLALLRSRRSVIWRLLEPCTVCPQECGALRHQNERGVCRTGRNPVVYTYFPHFGEEPPIVGERGSGTIFFGGCNMSCVYCQNFGFSQKPRGGIGECTADDVARMMLELQEKGCHNINWVTPTHFVPQILLALEIALSQGLDLPLVYNTGGYDKVETLRLLEGIVDIYLADMRYADDETALRYSKIERYAQVNRAAVLEMHRQVGRLVIEDGLAQRGVLIRHLVLPGGISGTEKILDFIADYLPIETAISLMGQYTPLHRSDRYTEINRRLQPEEYEAAVEALQMRGFRRAWVQDLAKAGAPVSAFAGVHYAPRAPGAEFSPAA